MSHKRKKYKIFKVKVSISMFPNNGMAAGAWIFNMHTDVDAYVAHRGFTDTIGESATEVDSVRKILCCNRDSNPH